MAEGPRGLQARLMRAAVYDRYGPPEVLRVEDVEAPSPRADEVLVRIHAAAVTRADCATREANLLRRLKLQKRAPIRTWTGSRHATSIRRRIGGEGPGTGE